MSAAGTWLPAIRAAPPTCPGRDSVDIGVSIATPHGAAVTPDHEDGVEFTVAADYLFITRRDIR